MPFVILAFFIGIPIAEITVFIDIGGRIGLAATLGLVVVTAIVGTVLLRNQGLATLEKARRSLENHRFPVDEVFDGLCLLVAGALLLTPGFVTDGFGLLLFLPPLRALLRKWTWNRMVAGGRVSVGTGGQGPVPPEGSTVIDGDFEVVETSEEPRHDGTGKTESPTLP